MFAECGPITYSVENPDYEVFSIDSSSVTTDNSRPIRIEVQTNNSFKIPNFADVKKGYQFQVTVQLELFKTHPDSVTYSYYSPSESDRKEALNFKLRDYCREATFLPPSSLIIPDLTEVYDWQMDPTVGTLMINKKVLSNPTDFYLSKLTYQTEEENETGVTNPCGA